MANSLKQNPSKHRFRISKLSCAQVLRSKHLQTVLFFFMLPAPAELIFLTHVDFLHFQLS